MYRSADDLWEHLERDHLVDEREVEVNVKRKRLREGCYVLLEKEEARLAGECSSLMRG